jgi:hypothetical protein
MGLMVNCTPHPITLVVEGKNYTLNPSGITIRLKTEEKQAGEVEFFVNGNERIKVPVVRQELRDITVLKDGKELTKEEIERELGNADIVIVPLIVGQKANELRKFLGKPELRVFVPNTAKAVRDENGNIIGVPSFIEF